MEQCPGVTAETDSNALPSVEEVILASNWGADYPLELLSIGDADQRLLDLKKSGLTYPEISNQTGILFQLVVSRYNAAKGKSEALESHTSGDFSLTPLAKRVIVLNHLFGVSWQKSSPLVILSDPELVIKKTNLLDKRIGTKWRRFPKIIAMSDETLIDRIDQYDAVLGVRWRNAPTLLTLNPEKVQERIAIYNGWFGIQWQVKPSLVANRPETVASSARALKQIGITAENSTTSAYFGLLGTTVANKRQKAAKIRRHILGHRHINIHEDKVPKSELVKRRRNQTLLERKTEEHEIEEFKAFIRVLGAKGLGRSMSEISSWASTHGYTMDKWANNSRLIRRFKN